MSDNNSRESIEAKIRASIFGTANTFDEKLSSQDIEDQMRTGLVSPSQAQNVLLYLADLMLVEGFLWTGHAIYQAADVLTAEAQPPRPGNSQSGQVVPFRKPKPPGCER